MGEFDLSLIREFRSRPAFYDRNSPLFKDKVFTAREWQLIANKLGYDVSLLKDRMLQLRNRYNLEKRRLEQLREENPGKSVISPWPLYNQLHFLSEHIRTRRSYKRMLPLHDTLQMPTPPEDEHSFSESEYSPNALVTADTYPNGLVTVKMEEGDVNNAVSCDVSETNMASDDNHANAELSHNRPNAQHSNFEQQKHSEHQKQSQQLPVAITLRRLDTMREVANTIPKPHQNQKGSRCNNNSNNTLSAECINNVVPFDKWDRDLSNPTKRRCLNRREQKYAAFGNFMSASLLDLPPQKALLLLEKFTSEIVRVIIEKADDNIKATNS